MVLCNYRGRKRGKDIVIFIFLLLRYKYWFTFQLSKGFFYFSFTLQFIIMTHIYYTSATALIFFAIYRPFITKLDTVKYITLGGISFMIPYLISYNNKFSMTTETTVSSTNSTMHHYSPITENATFDHFTMYALMDAIVYLLISIFTVSINGLLTRWQFPITFIKPRANAYVSGLIRHGVSTLLVILAILR